MLRGFSARDLQIAAAGWPITSVPTKISGVADFSTFCGLICPPVATPPQSQRFGEEWTKKKSRKMNIFKALSWKINQICSWLREVWKPLIVSDPDPFGQSLLSWVENMSENICFWCPHEKCDGILWREKAGGLSSDRLLSVEAAAAFYSQMTSLISNSPRFHFKDDTDLGLKTLLIGPQWPHTHMLGMGLVYCIYCAWLKM